MLLSDFLFLLYLTAALFLPNPPKHNRKPKHCKGITPFSHKKTHVSLQYMIVSPKINSNKNGHDFKSSYHGKGYTPFVSHILKLTKAACHSARHRWSPRMIRRHKMQPIANNTTYGNDLRSMTNGEDQKSSVSKTHCLKYRSFIPNYIPTQQKR